METRNNYELAQQSLNTRSQVDGTDCVVLSIETAKHISELLSLKNNSPLDTPSQEPSKVLKLSNEEVQMLRDEVREMAFKGKPKDGIPLYQGKKSVPDAVEFFKKYYAQYNEPDQEVIFAPDLMRIDAPLIRALRNECRSPSTPMPLGRAEERTNARIEGRFSDGENLKHSIRQCLIRRQALLEGIKNQE